MSMQQQQQQLAAQQQLQQMQMQRQAIANAHTPNPPVSSYPPSGAPVSASGMPTYTPQQIATAAASAGLTNVGGLGPQVSQQKVQQGASIRAYLDSTVIPVLLEGTFYWQIRNRKRKTEANRGNFFAA